MLGMEQMYKMALDPRIYPDSRLLSIMQGRDQSLPMAIAMAAKQQRDKLKTAETGAQAQQGAKQPTVKDKMLASSLPPEHTGLGALPAENMDGMDEAHMAAGGIVAFADRGLVDLEEALQKDEDTDQKPSPLRGRLFGDFGSKLQGFSDKNTVVPTVNATPTQAELTALQKGGPQDPTYISPEMQAEINRRSAATPRQTGVGTPPSQGGAAANAAQNLGIGEPSKRVDRFAGLGETQETFDKKLAAEKNAGQAEFLMNMGLKMMTTVGPIGKAIGEGGIAGLPSLSASRKTIRELEKARSDFQLNMARYQTAADEGDMELAYKYKALAEKTAHDAGMLAVERTKAGAYAASVGSKEDIAGQKREASIMGIAKGLLEKNMKYGLPNTSPEEKQAIEQAAINSAVNMYNSATAATGSAKGFKYLGKET